MVPASALYTALRAAKLLDNTQINDTWIHQGKECGLWECLIDSELVPYETLRDFLRKEYGTPEVDISEVLITKEIISMIPYETAVRYTILPVFTEKNRLILAMKNPFDFDALNDALMCAPIPPVPRLARAKDIKHYISKFYAQSHISTIASQFIVEENLKSGKYPKELDTDIHSAPAVKLIDSLIDTAVHSNASDIHIEPFENLLRTRYRIDGRLTVFQNVDKSLHPNIIARLKVMGRMILDEKRRPQDGSFQSCYDGANIDFRLSTMPTARYGEKAVIRIMYNSAPMRKHELGFLPQDLEKINELFKRTGGLVLVTGPTGSGKNTTLTAFLEELNTVDVNIVTIEDPVENVLYGVNQVSVRPRHGLDFADVLRSALRQDPDIIMLGEIRDLETATSAIRAAMTGHFVLSTLHTNDAASAVVRLVEMGVPRYLVGSTVKGVLHQQLARRLCEACKTEETLGPERAALLGAPEGTKVYKPAGCHRCGNTGYSGRFALCEVFIMDDDLRAVINENGTREEIKSVAKMTALWENAREHVLLGHTSIEEVERFLHE
ncbi:MAG: GspE/PulE family protein [Clostridiales bacterium]|jgi:type IV pilus assembly protein PilB|nr:GspE/PulE family protein [Clostridiales bacterium]